MQAGERCAVTFAFNPNHVDPQQSVQRFCKHNHIIFEKKKLNQLEYISRSANSYQVQLGKLGGHDFLDETGT